MVSFRTIIAAFGAVPLTDASVLLRGSSSSGIEDCGALASFPNAKPKNFADSKKEKYDPDLKKKVPVIFKPGDKIPFECEHGFTIDGSMDGETVFDVLCDPNGFYEPKGVCSEASKCGSIPKIKYALPTGRKVHGNLEMSCQEGYSLDGLKTTPGGMQKNQLFTLKCVEFSGKYEKFEGECKPAGHVPASQMAGMYNEVFHLLFVMSCRRTIFEEFHKGNSPGTSDSCSHVTEHGFPDDCKKLTDQIKADFDRIRDDQKAWDEGKAEYKKLKKEYRNVIPVDDEAKAKRKELKQKANEIKPVGPRPPGLQGEGDEFCEGMWDALKIQPGNTHD